MKRGFQYDTALCVSCKACSAACILENGLQPGTRSVYVWNNDALPPFSVINLSLACNHCAKPACLEGCPAKAYTIDSTGAVIHHHDRCMGCGYCTWKCPYDAPKINVSMGYIEKCHFCYERANEGVDPACVTACPTGAIRIIYEEDYPERNVTWFPETGIGPSVKLTVPEDHNRPIIIPQEDDDSEVTPPPSENKIRKEWSLLIFSILVIMSAALIISSYLAGTLTGRGVSALMLGSAMIISFVHLGVRRRAWRALLNIISSPLSREIASVGILTILSAINYFRPGLLPPLVTPVMALLTLISVDVVYFSADRSTGMMLHSGQAFFSGILAASYFSNALNAFIIFTLLAAGSIVLRSKSLSRATYVRNLYYYRALSLPVVLMLLYMRNEWSGIVAIVLFVTGMLADRALFYEDFKPENIKDKISELLYNDYEKERDKQRQNAAIP